MKSTWRNTIESQTGYGIHINLLNLLNLIRKIKFPGSFNTWVIPVVESSRTEVNEA